MKKLFVFLIAGCCFSIRSNSQLLKKISDKVKDKTIQRADQKTDQAIDKGLDKTEEAIKDPAKDDGKGKGNTTTAFNKKNTVVPGNTGNTPSLKVYNNYDFVPGDKILFEDHFTDDQDGEFATHWELKSGQAVLNKLNSELAMHLTDGNYARVLPRMKNGKYLSDPFTIEYDYYHVPGAYGLITMLRFYDKEGGYDREANLFIKEGEASFAAGASNVNLNKMFPEALAENFDNKWHHVAIAIKNHQLKVYVDEYRVLLVPDTKEDYTDLEFAGIGSETAPVIFKNVRIAAGGNMNLIGKKFTDSKIITHGINFDVNKATIKPESMGTLNMIVQVMKDNPEIRFEVGGHTDADGNNDSNLKLSQQRADAVKEALIKLGIDNSKLIPKGYGENKPVSDNTSPEGKANNRRVEFVKM